MAPDRPDRRPVPSVATWPGAFGRFVWDFVVGDTPELAVAALVIIGVAALLVHVGAPAALAGVILVGLVAVALTLSAGRARRSGRHQ
jgi:hypothetical protein